MSKLIGGFILAVLVVASCVNPPKESEKIESERDIERVVIERVTLAKDDTCFKYLKLHMKAMEDRDAIRAKESLRVYSLECYQDTLIWIEGMLDISKRIYDAPDSVIFYAHGLLDRADHDRALKKHELQLNLAFAHDFNQQYDSACHYLRLIYDSGMQTEYETFYSDRLLYCFD